MKLTISFLVLLLSVPLFSQTNAPAFYSQTDDVWLNALSKTEQHADVVRIKKSLGKTNELSDIDEFIEGLYALKLHPWHKQGITFGFSKMPPKRLNDIYFYNKSSIHTAAKNLPFGLSFSDTEEIIEKRYGKYLTADPKGGFTIQVFPVRHPFVFMKINMDEGKVGHAVSLYYDEYAAYQTNPAPHNLKYNVDLCVAIAAMINDVDNKFFNYRGAKTDDLFPTWESNVVLDTEEVANTIVNNEQIVINGYIGTDQDSAAYAYDTLYGYFDICVEDGEIPFSWTRVEEDTDSEFTITLTTKEKNVIVEHHFKMEEQRFTVEKDIEFSAYTIIRFSED